MSKRRISQQQLSRIQGRQKKYQTDTNSELNTGLVIARFGKHVLIETENNVVIRCAIRSNIESLTAGDRVMWQTDSHQHGIVMSCLPRQSVLNRMNEQGVSRAIAANLTQVIIVVAPNPTISWTLLDSYLVMAETLNLSACIVLNKTDLDCELIKNILQSDYSHLGYPIILINREAKEVTELNQHLQNNVNVFVGQSGVGKSSLINLLLPNEKSEIKTAAVSESSNLGCHTTRNARLYHLPEGGALIDSPGVREFSLHNLSAVNIAEGYCEFRPYLGQCKFRNCEHITSPGCAILEAVKNTAISRRRYENYVKINTQS